MSDALPVLKLDDATLAREINEEHAKALLMHASERALRSSTSTYTGHIVRDAAIEAGIASDDIDAVLLAYFRPEHTQTHSLEALLERKAHQVSIELNQILAGMPIGYKAIETRRIEGTVTQIVYTTSVRKEQSSKYLVIDVKAQTLDPSLKKGYSENALFQLSGFEEESFTETTDEQPSLLQRVQLAWSVLMKGPEGIRPPARLIIAEPDMHSTPRPPMEVMVVTSTNYDDIPLEEFLKTQLGRIDSDNTTRREGLIAYAIANCVPAIKKDYDRMIQLNRN